MNVMVEEDPFSKEYLSSDDSFEEFKELESKLYSVIHYNDLSETVPTDLPDGYEIKSNEYNEIVVTLKEDDENKKCIVLEVIHNEIESNETETLSNSHELSQKDSPTGKRIRKNDSDDDVVIIDTSENESDVVMLGNKTEISSRVTHTFNFPNPLRSAEIIDNKKSALPENHNQSRSQNCEEICLISSSDEDTSKKHNSDKVVSNHITKNKRKLKRLQDKQCPKKWTKSMMSFYSKCSRRKLNFDIFKLKMKMREKFGKADWFLNNKDINNKLNKSPRRQRCLRCKQHDHDTKNCREPIKPIVCFMCGEIGHRQARCPHKKCLTCGRPTPIFVQMCNACTQEVWKRTVSCTICDSTYHSRELCPDVWRGLHATTKPGEIVIPTLCTYTTKKVCCNCGREGHLDYECYEINNSGYVASKPFINSYVSVAEYTASENGKLSIIVKLNNEEAKALSGENGHDFLQNLSNTTEARIELVTDMPSRSLAVFGSNSQCSAVISSVCTFFERYCRYEKLPHKNKTKRRPSFKKKRRTI